MAYMRFRSETPTRDSHPPPEKNLPLRTQVEDFRQTPNAKRKILNTPGIKDRLYNLVSILQKTKLPNGFS
jgi:hypothetical protein